MKSKRTIKFGKGEGPATWWYENGKKESRGTFKNGKKEGLWTFWYDNGRKIKEGAFEDGNLENKLISFTSVDEKLLHYTVLPYDYGIYSLISNIL